MTVFSRISQRFGIAASSFGLAASLTAGLAMPVAAHAEGQLRIAEQFGIVYLLLNVAQDQKLVEKHGKAAGVDVKVEYVKLSGGSAVNDALLSGSIDIAGAGVGPLLTIWDRTYGKQNVRGVASLGNFPYYLVSNNPAVKTIADFSDKDRIALPAVGVSVQSRVLQLASAKLWGDKELQPPRQNPGGAAAPRRGGGHHQRRHRDHRPLRQPALPGAGAGRQPGGAHRAEFL
jgi:NitT/TauT family transport system substrate-binding protein